jgi:hypothetical protein
VYIVSRGIGGSASDFIRCEDCGEVNARILGNN